MKKSKKNPQQKQTFFGKNSFFSLDIFAFSATFDVSISRPRHEGMVATRPAASSPVARDPRVRVSWLIKTISIFPAKSTKKL